ncbi:hypothetical protein BD414DRAFT_540035 [Trametes punicea]|nr:hypothetical protein BD414DRAFT_540035 [Trametes punicea]
MPLTLEGAAVLSTSIEGILYGYFILLFTSTMWILVKNRRRRRLSYDVSEKTFVTKSCLYCLQTLILDGIVILRTYVVWGSRLVIIVPVIGYCGLVAATIGSNIALATASSHSGDIFAVQTGRWITAVYSLTLGTNLSSTRYSRICTVSLRHERPAHPVLRAIVESGAIYSMAITAGLVTFLTHSNGVYVVLDMLSPIISIVFNMIIVRIGLASDRRILQVDPTTHVSDFVATAHPWAHHGISMDITQFLEDTSTAYAPDEEVSSGRSDFGTGKNKAVGVLGASSPQVAVRSQPSDGTAM